MLPHHKHFSSYERNLPTRIGDARYRYNAEGHRYYSEVGGVTMVTIMDGDRNVGTFRAVNGTNWQLSYWNIHGNGLEGRYDNPNVVFHKRFYHKDHLGSTRVVVNASGTIVGAYDYYPFGLQMPGRSGNSSNPHALNKFTGYEIEEEGGQNTYHAEARGYDPVIGRFTSVDPMASLMPGWNPYHYSFNNPVIFTDSTGLKPDLVFDHKQKPKTKDIFEKQSFLEKQFHLPPDIFEHRHTIPVYRAIDGGGDTKTPIETCIGLACADAVTAFVATLELNSERHGTTFRMFSRLSTVAGIVLGGYSLYKDHNNPNVSSGLFAYRATGYTATLATPVLLAKYGSVGGPKGTIIGAGVGFLFVGGEYVYVGMIYTAQVYQQETKTFKSFYNRLEYNLKQWGNPYRR